MHVAHHCVAFLYHCVTLSSMLLTRHCVTLWTAHILLHFVLLTLYYTLYCSTLCYTLYRCITLSCMLLTLHCHGVAQDEGWQKSGVVEMLQRALEICRKDHESGCQQALNVLPFHKTVISLREQAPSSRLPGQQDDRVPAVRMDPAGPLPGGLGITITNGAFVCTVSPTNIVVRNGPIGVTPAAEAGPVGTTVPPQAPVSSGAAVFRQGEASASRVAAGVGPAEDAAGPGTRELHRPDPEGAVQPNIIIVAQPTTGMRGIPYQSPRAQLPFAPLFGRPTITSSQSGPVTGARDGSRRVDTRSLSSPGRLTTSGFYGSSPIPRSLALAAERAVREADRTADRTAQGSPAPAADTAVRPPPQQVTKAEALHQPSPVPAVPAAAEVVSAPPASHASKRLFEDTVDLPMPISAFVKPLQAQGTVEERCSADAELERNVKVEAEEVEALGRYISAFFLFPSLFPGGLPPPWFPTVPLPFSPGVCLSC